MKAETPEANLKGLNSLKSSSGYPRGKLEVIAGPMFAGKSSELLKRLLFLTQW